LAVGWLAVAGAWAIGGLRFEGLFTALVGAVVTGGIVWGTRAGASLALGREAMGLGDVTLMAMVGAWLGWQASVLACFLGVLFGLVHAVVQIVRHRESELPFGPGLCMGTATVVINRVRASAIGMGPGDQVRRTLSRFGGIENPHLIPDDRPAMDAALLAGRTLAEVAPRSAARQAMRQLVRALAPDTVRPTGRRRRVPLNRVDPQ
jgi:Flp pilus assembly protein protease CpaA